MPTTLKLDKHAWNTLFESLDEDVKIELINSVKADIVKTHIAKLVGQEEYTEIKEAVTNAIFDAALDEFGSITREWKNGRYVWELKRSKEFDDKIATIKEQISKEVVEELRTHAATMSHEYRNGEEAYIKSMHDEAQHKLNQLAYQFDEKVKTTELESLLRRIVRDELLGLFNNVS